MDAPVVYVVRFWVAPETEQELIDWIDNGHLQEVVDQPGFLWGRRLTLDDRDGQGWQGYLNLYGLESREAFEAYQRSDIQAKFQQEASRFAEHMRIERGLADLALSVSSRTGTGSAA
jgi:hypothetical protein